MPSKTTEHCCLANVHHMLTINTNLTFMTMHSSKYRGVQKNVTYSTCVTDSHISNFIGHIFMFFRS